jgi:hypothetical protein
MSVTNGPRRGLMINALTGDNFDFNFRGFLRAIDALLMCSVINRTTSAPPGSPANGDAYIVQATGSGAWTGHDNAIAIWTTDNPASAGEWEFYAAAGGVLVYSVADTSMYFWNGTAWTAVGGGGGGGGSSTLAGDTDVLITSPANLDLLTYDTASSKWKNLPAAGGGGGGGSPNFADNETLTGSALSWTLAHTPSPASSLQLFIYQNNGFAILIWTLLEQVAGTPSTGQYSISGTTVTLHDNPGAVAPIAFYRY